MPAGDGWRGDLRGLGPEFENLQGRKSREGIRRWCGALCGDLAAAGRVADGCGRGRAGRPMRLRCERDLFV